MEIFLFLFICIITFSFNVYKIILLNIKLKCFFLNRYRTILNFPNRQAKLSKRKIVYVNLIKQQ